jgi:hypothetical protein
MTYAMGGGQRGEWATDSRGDVESGTAAMGGEDATGTGAGGQVALFRDGAASEVKRVALLGHQLVWQIWGDTRFTGRLDFSDQQTH